MTLPASSRTLSRRLWLKEAVAGAAAIAASACKSTPPTGPGPTPTPTPTPTPAPGSARLSARPHAPAATLGPGTHPLGLGTARDGLLHVPPTYDAGNAIPLVLILHGLGGHVGELNKTEVMPMTPPISDQFGVAFLFPEMRGTEWDRAFTPDVAFLDAALAQTFNRLHVNAARIACWGFSDGASYSLSMGLCNGDLFSHIAAFSPEIMNPPQPTGQPRVFVTHGRTDPFIPVASTRDGIVPNLRNRGYTVDYVEVEGGHVIDPTARAQAIAAFLA